MGDSTMPKIAANIVLMGIFLCSAPCAAATTTVTNGTQPAGIGLELGHADFLTYCAACHGVGGQGDGTVAEYLTINAADLTLLKKKNGGIFPKERISNVIDGRAAVKVHGPRDMPVWGDWFKFEAESSKNGKGVSEVVVRDRIDALVRYIESIQTN
jgi:mono/diheme cytochrome c family protein